MYLNLFGNIFTDAIYQLIFLCIFITEMCTATCYVNLAIFSESEDVLVVKVSSVLKLLHPAPHGHLDNLQTGAVYLLDQAEDRGKDIGILETKKQI